MSDCKKNLAEYSTCVQGEIQQLIRELCAIPAPSNHEEKRAAFCQAWFQRNGFEDVTVDEALNVLVPVGILPNQPYALCMAHTDTVFPDLSTPHFFEQHGIMHCPGVGDDTAHLAIMMISARIFNQHRSKHSSGILFAANSGEEGLGNLKGSRAIFQKRAHEIYEVVSLDYPDMETLINKVVGSHRYQIQVHTEGGHSFSKFGNRNAIHVLSGIINTLYSVKVPQEGNSRTTYNVGMIYGGSSINTIAQDATILYEYRSDNRNCLKKMGSMLSKIIEAYQAMGIEIEINKIGDRPCAQEVDPTKFSNLKERVQSSAQAILGKRMKEGMGSSDINIPLSLGIPAVCFGLCNSTGTHTREEQLEVASLQNGTKLFLDFLQRSYLRKKQ